MMVLRAKVLHWDFSVTSGQRGYMGLGRKIPRLIEEFRPKRPMWERSEGDLSPARVGKNCQAIFKQTQIRGFGLPFDLSVTLGE